MNSLYIVLAPNGRYHKACLKMQWCNATQYLVISITAWDKWFFENISYVDSITPPPPPAFVGNSYEIASHIANELNTPTTPQEMKG